MKQTTTLSNINVREYRRDNKKWTISRS